VWLERSVVRNIDLLRDRGELMLFLGDLRWHQLKGECCRWLQRSGLDDLWYCLVRLLHLSIELKLLQLLLLDLVGNCSYSSSTLWRLLLS
jgi:hypothetical protein